ncbi:prolyl 4-hydroxylase subunit alpha-1 [Drosophila subpulchrella]|uniref:prolyl 4-hydroxylase subunit alpha-1 n=1 Tax=Drosophila subpulchrella TaxID=1486046 RepID=UPI0018A19FE7|nr:prolyl 4-hydroxylase subunit alpha-1 [Drosophila subpulchrella]
MSHPLGLFLGIFLLLIWSEAVKGEFYSSVDSMQDLAQVEQELLNATRSYLEAQQDQLNFYRRYMEQIKREHEWAVGQLKLDEYLGHPLHAFRLIKRLVLDWDELIFETILENKPREDFRLFVDALTKDLGYPDQSELQGAIKGLARLQRVYNLSTSDLADGVINGYHYDSELQWRESYEIGVQLFDLGEYKRSLEWLQVAFVLLRNSPLEEKDENGYLSDIREYAAMANFELGNPKRADRLLQQILTPEPIHSAQQTRKYLESRGPGKNVEEKDPSWFANYTRLCQGRRLPEKRSGNPLKCYLDGKRHAYFTLAPLQVEPVHLDPDINVYHGMLNSNQISDIFVEVDKEEMVRSSVSGEGGKRTVRDLRVSQQTWLNYTTPVMQSISQIIQFVSGFDMAGAEFMQVANYGVGGQYEPHSDYFEVNLPKEFEGDRISTSMFYLSNVEQGGYTVFTKLNLFLPPVKGALVMWHNLHRSLDVDVRTLHAGCPVIVGSKRIGNIWMHSGYQEFRRPCNLTSDSYKSVAYRNSE